MNERQCPICGKKFPGSEKKYRPFCSARCKEVDLGNWLMESYTLSSPIDSIEDMEKVLEYQQGENDH